MNMSVTAVEEKLSIKTYPEPKPQELPMFAFNRVHQRTSGNPYPNRVVLKVDRSKKEDREYAAVRLENEYIRIVILPELGGRIYSATDKTTGYDFFYKQNVIKPALIGALGSWISGGLEFNWPFHHRPSTFMPVDFHIEHEPDGSATVWLSEHDPIDRMKGMVGIRLCPKQAFFETRMKLFNRTEVTHSFLWWENAAVPVNREYQIFFPPDVSAVKFHYRRSVASYPIAKGVYNGIRMGDGTDIRYHKNTLNPTSYFSASSKYDFFGGYDCGKRCGIIHIASHFTCGGKKMFTWGYNQLSSSWKRVLTDTDGEYAELMAGSYTNNQPDFSWLEPYEAKSFSQFWYPIGAVGIPTFANLNAAIRLERQNEKITVAVQPTREFNDARLILTSNGKEVLCQVVDLAPAVISRFEGADTNGNCHVLIISKDGEAILDYTQETFFSDKLPEVFADIKYPNEMKTAQELYLAGIHVKQYRDPCVLPDVYWKESLKRDPDYVPALLALGTFYYEHAFYDEALEYLVRAISVSTQYNTNPVSGELSYMLGLVLLKIGKVDEAYNCFMKSAWNSDRCSQALTMVSAIDGSRGDYNAMLLNAKKALVYNSQNALAQVYEAIALLGEGKTEAGVKVLQELLQEDPLDHPARYMLIHATEEPPDVFFEQLSCFPDQICLDLAFDLTRAGQTGEAIQLLDGLCKRGGDVSPMVYYTLGSLYGRVRDNGKAEQAFLEAEFCRFEGPFPSRLDELDVLKEVTKMHPHDALATYLMGCLLYDKGHFVSAEECFEKVIKDEPDFFAAYRNLAVIKYSSRNDRQNAVLLLEKALSLDKGNEQLIFELLYVMARLGTPPDERLKLLEENKTFSTRDDILLEWARAHNQNGEPMRALEILTAHEFVPCEGGEHAVAEQYMFAYHIIGRRHLSDGSFSQAISAFRSAQKLPDNLGSGLWHEAMLVPNKYYEAVCLLELGETQEAFEMLNDIIILTVDYFSNMHLPSLPYYQALSLEKLGKIADAQIMMNSRLAEWTKEKKQKAFGYFKSTPFFISYCDNGSDVRMAHYSYLCGLARLYLGDRVGARNEFENSLAYDGSQLYCQIELKFIDEGKGWS